MNHFGFDGCNPAIVLHASFQINDGAWPSAMCPEDLFARVGDLHRALGFTSCNSSDDFKRNDFAFAPKASADERLDHPNLRHRHLEDERKLVLQVVRNLR